MWPSAVRLSQADGKQGRVGDGVMVQYIDFFFSQLSNAPSLCYVARGWCRTYGVVE